MTTLATPRTPDTGKTGKPRLPILDGLRGVAALIVVAFHIFDSDPVNSVNHGYLAVDFFFMLSGYVMGYAYDDRWGTMTAGTFFRRRLVRLHPMVVIGSLIGGVCFYFGESALFPEVAKTSPGMLASAMLAGALMIPWLRTPDIRGWGESYPLNGPQWSLLFEYIANVAYAFWIRKFGLRTLTVSTVVFAGLLTWVVVGGETGSVSLGWLPTAEHFGKGMVRMLFPFLAGLLLFRAGKRLRWKHALPGTTVILLVAFAMPRVGPADAPWINGLYECAVIVLLLPAVVLLGAGSLPASRFGTKACDLLGDLSYPLYLVHYPVHYVFFAWLDRRGAHATDRLPAALGVYLACVALGYAVMRFADEPVRKRLARFAR